MIIEYHRPETISAALDLLARTNPTTVPMGGGTRLSRYSHLDLAVVDLQRLGLDGLALGKNALQVGAAVTLQTLAEAPSLPEALRCSAYLDAGLNVRNTATVAGAIVAGDGRSPLLTVLLAMDARLTWQPQNETVGLGDWLALRPNRQKNYLLTEIQLPANVEVSMETVARTPVDTPIVCVAVCRWQNSNRVRIVVGGFGDTPVLASDGQDDAASASLSVKNACSQSDDAWASAAYRRAAAAVLVNRIMKREN